MDESWLRNVSHWNPFNWAPSQQTLAIWITWNKAFWQNPHSATKVRPKLGQHKLGYGHLNRTKGFRALRVSWRTECFTPASSTPLDWSSYQALSSLLLQKDNDNSQSRRGRAWEEIELRPILTTCLQPLLRALRYTLFQLEWSLWDAWVRVRRWPISSRQSHEFPRMLQ